MTESTRAWRSARKGWASDVPYSVDYFARKHDISTKQARELMCTLGRNPTSSMRLLQSCIASPMRKFSDRSRRQRSCTPRISIRGR